MRLTTKARFGALLLAALLSLVATLCMSAAEPLSLAVDEAQGRLQVNFEGRPLMVYSFATNQFKPYVRELYSLRGVNLLRDAPADHLHHHGLMYAIRVNGVNFWEERDQPGVEKSVPLLRHHAGRDARGRPEAGFTQWIHWIAESNRWVGDSQSVALLIEQRTLTLTIDERAGEVALRWQAEFEAGPGATRVRLEGSEYNGLGLRLPTDFDFAARHINSENAPYSAAQKRDLTAARWSAVSRPAGDPELMAALFSRPSNKGETQFYTMIDPFAYLSVTQNLAKEPLEYAAHEKFFLDYLLCVYSESKSSEFLGQRQQRWERE